MDMRLRPLWFVTLAMGIAVLIGMRLFGLSLATKCRGTPVTTFAFL
jgi:hypothetical protein